MKKVPCIKCKGTGWIENRGGAFGDLDKSHTCYICNGTCFVPIENDNTVLTYPYDDYKPIAVPLEEYEKSYNEAIKDTLLKRKFKIV